MTLTFSDVLIALVLIICVPVQYFLVQNWGKAESSRSYALTKLYNQAVRFRDEYLCLHSWKKWVVEELGLEDLFPEVITIPDDDVGESPAVEVMQYKHKHGYFAFSQDPRIVRPPEVEFRIGQVVIHKHYKYRGVIVGWDETTKAPPEWLDALQGKDKTIRKTPNYFILVDTRDRLSPQLTYVPQENLENINSQIIHPFLDDHFESFDGAQYIPRPWLKAMYPQD